MTRNKRLQKNQTLYLKRKQVINTVNGLKRTARRVTCLTLAAATLLTMTLTAAADEPYESYNYNNWDEAIPSQSAYTVQKTITGSEMGLGRLNDEEDELYVYPGYYDAENASADLSEEVYGDADEEEEEQTEDASDEEEEADVDSDEDDSDEDSDIASASLNSAKDFYVYNDEEIWIADSGNNRILRLDSDYQIIGRYYGVYGESESDASVVGDMTVFKSPSGIFVMESPTTGLLTVWIADADNSRVVRATVEDETTLSLEMEYLKPDEALYTSETFNPSKVLVDYAENVYAIVKSVNTGSVQFAADGSFTGFYGANRVEVTASVIAQNLWRKIASNAQISGMSRNVPVEYANFDIDDDGFIYTVTETSTDTDAVKKVNPAGYNIWDNTVGDEYQFGDITDAVWDTASNKTYSTKLTDIKVDSDGIMNVLDYETGRVFQYDRLANLICIFGTKTSAADQRGSFSSPNAVETIGNTVIVLEGSTTRNDITVFEQTTFGENLHMAFSYYDEGLYLEAVPYWNEIMKRDGCYTYAYVGLGKADLKNGDYAAALDKFETANDQDDYDKAFEYYRNQWLEDNFTGIAVVVVILIVLWIIHKILKKKGIKLFKKRKKKEASE